MRSEQRRIRVAASKWKEINWEELALLKTRFECVILRGTRVLDKWGLFMFFDIFML